MKTKKRKQVEEMKRRTFTAEYKTKIILEVLRGEKELNVIATENELAPNQVRNWKAEFLKNATAAFEDKRTEELRCELQSKQQETAELYKKIGQLTTQVDWLKKNLTAAWT